MRVCGTANPLEQPDRLWVQEDGGWVDRAAELGVDDPGMGRTMVAADIDRDGTLDLVTWQLIEGPRIYRGRPTGGSWLRVELDAVGTRNRFAVGARVEVWSQDGARLGLQDLQVGSTGAFSSGPPELHFGLGAHEVVDVVVRWPDGELTVNEGVDARGAIRLTRG